MKTAIQKTPEGQILVTADLKAIPHRDFDSWTLHLMPELFLPSWEWVREFDLAQVSLRVECPQLNVLPAIALVLRQPFPNARCLVAGTTERKTGWLVTLETLHPRLDLLLEWVFEAESEISDLYEPRIRHRLCLELKPTENGKTFSTTRAVNQGGGRASTKAAVDEDDAEGLYGLRVEGEEFYGPGHVSMDNWFDPEVDDEYGYIEVVQTVVLQSLPWSEVTGGLEEFENGQLFRDIEQRTSLTTHLEEYRAAADLEIPASVLVEAIDFARQVPFDRENGNFENLQLESHPAMRLLADWWNRNCPVPEHRTAAHCMLWVRVEDNGECACAYYETPAWPLAYFQPSFCASWSPFVIAGFVQSRTQSFKDEEGWCCSLQVDGEIFERVGEPLDDHDPAWYGLVGLQQFPERFPVAWQALVEIARYDTRLGLPWRTPL